MTVSTANFLQSSSVLPTHEGKLAAKTDKIKKKQQKKTAFTQEVWFFCCLLLEQFLSILQLSPFFPSKILTSDWHSEFHHNCACVTIEEVHQTFSAAAQELNLLVFTDLTSPYMKTIGVSRSIILKQVLERVHNGKLNHCYTSVLRMDKVKGDFVSTGTF